VKIEANHEADEAAKEEGLLGVSPTLAKTRSYGKISDSNSSGCSREGE
jgi:hypothetical protein